MMLSVNIEWITIMNSSSGTLEHRKLCDAIIQHLRTMEGLDLKLDCDARTFGEMGADSTAMMMVSLEFEEKLETELPPHLLWDCPDIDRFADYLIANVPEDRRSAFFGSD